MADPHYRFSGVLSPVVTPFTHDLSPDATKLVSQCRWLTSQSVGLAVFGTNSEANSLSVEEKCSLLDALVESGIPADSLMPGTGCCALPDTVRLTRHAVNLGCGGVLMLPPFYYKDVSDDGLFASYAEIIERVADDRLNIYLYHIPPIARVGISLGLIDRLLQAFPGTVVGIKDSSGDWENTRAMHAREWEDFHIFVGSETLLLENMKHGGTGCISATANVNPRAIHSLYAGWREDGAEALQSELDALRAIVQAYPMIPALKAIVARYSGDDDWKTVRPPLVALDDESTADLYSKLDDIGFDMPGLG